MKCWFLKWVSHTKIKKRKKKNTEKRGGGAGGVWGWLVDIVLIAGEVCSPGRQVNYILYKGHEVTPKHMLQY